MRAIDILSDHQVKRTSCREGIIAVMMNADKALSEDEIREQIEGNYDRTTFYRSFKTLEEHAIIHKIVVDSQTVKYALDSERSHGLAHVHFYCNECCVVTCLDDVLVQRYHLPAGYSDDETEVLIKGVCAICKSRGEQKNEVSKDMATLSTGTMTLE